MVIDSSAVAAILFDEPDGKWFEAAILTDAVRIMSAASIVEISIVLDRRYRDKTPGELDLFVARTRINVISFSLEQAEIARQAHRQYGRGRHKAGLNFGDCFSYALSKVSRESLLCKGNDFALTDLAVISPPPSPQNS